MNTKSEPGTSMATVRGMYRLTTALPVDSGAGESLEHADDFEPSSPHLGSIPPSPGSPSGDSVSSFPSVSSSFLFSSGPASPPHPSHLRDLHEEERDFSMHMHDSTRGLIIPSLSLPSPARRPTPYGQALGDLRLLVLAPRRAASATAALAVSLIEDNEDIVDAGVWEDWDDGPHAVVMECEDPDAGNTKASILRASTAWVEHRDAHGLESVEPARNVEIVELPGYDPSDDAETIAGRVLPIVHAPFFQLNEALHPSYAPSALLANLLASGSSPVYTALILLLTSSPTPTEKCLLDALSPHVPLIVIPPLPVHPSYPFYPYSHGYSSEPDSSYSSPVYPSDSHSAPVTTAPISTFRPETPHALCAGLFRTPETLAHLREEGVARFLRWREVERAVERISAGVSSRLEHKPLSGLRTKSSQLPDAKGKRWDKAKWEAEWEGTLSQDIAVGLQRRQRANTALPRCVKNTVTEMRPAVFLEPSAGESSRQSPSCAPVGIAFDPLHVRSIFLFSLSLLGPLRKRIFGRQGAVYENTEVEAVATRGMKKKEGGMRFGLGLALVGAFCAGIGLGLYVSRIERMSWCTVCV